MEFQLKYELLIRRWCIEKGALLLANDWRICIQQYIDLSERSIHRNCKQRNIHPCSHFSNAQLDSVIVGHSYGRKTMQGLLHSKGIRIGQKVMSIGCSVLHIMQQAMVRNFIWIKMKWKTDEIWDHSCCCSRRIQQEDHWIYHHPSQKCYSNLCVVQATTN